MWAQSDVTTAGEGAEDITLIIMTHPMPFHCLSSANQFFSSHLIIFKFISGSVNLPKQPPRVPALSN